MQKIRYKEINRDKFEIIVPDHDEAPIGYVYRDIMKKTNNWFIKPYFITLYKDERTLKTGYYDFTEAGRSLVDIWTYTKFLTTKEETTEKYYLNDIFKNLGP